MEPTGRRKALERWRNPGPVLRYAPSGLRRYRHLRCSHSHWSGYSRIQPSTTEVTACIVPWMSICPDASRTGFTSSDSSARKRLPGRRMMRVPWIGQSTCRSKPRQHRVGPGLAAEEGHLDAVGEILVDQHGDVLALLQRFRELQAAPRGLPGSACPSSPRGFARWRGRRTGCSVAGTGWRHPARAQPRPVPAIPNCRDGWRRSGPACRRS